MQTPIRIFRTYATVAPVINRYANQEQPVRLFSDDDDFDYPPQIINHTVDPRYVLRRVDVSGQVNKIDYSMCFDADDEKMC